MTLFSGHSGPGTRRAAAMVLAWLAGAAWWGPVHAQRARTAREPDPLATYVPAGARVFLSARGLQSLSDLLRTTHAWRALSMAGLPVAADGPPPDLVAQAAQILGIEPDSVRDLADVELGVIADGGLDPSRAVWLARLPDPLLVDRWYPPSKRTARASVGGAHKFRMKDGLIVGVRGDVMVVGRRWPGDAVLLDVFRALQGDDVAVLESVAGYQELARRLPDRWQAFGFFQWKSSGADAPATGNDGDAVAVRDRRANAPSWLMVALYPNEQGLEIAVRGAIPHQWASPRVEPHALERLLQLPSSTLAGVVFRPSWSAISMTPPASSMRALADRFLRFLARLYNVAPESVGPLPRIGPHVVIAWDQDMNSSGGAPELAVLIESDNPAQLRDALAGLFSNWMMLIERHGGSAPRDMRITTTEHLGQTIMSLSLGSLAKNSELPVARLLGGLAPSWVATDHWLVVGLSRGHVERIVDAQRGLVLPVGALQDTRQFQQSRPGSTSAVFVQANLAAAVLDRWVAAASEGSPSLFGSGWRSAISGGPASPPRRMLGISARPEEGAAVVTAVRENGASAGVLEVGDRILGVDGQLLDLAAPNADLRRRVSESAAGAGPVLRVEREGQRIDLVVPMRGDAAGEPASASNAPVDTLIALSDLATLARHVVFIGAGVDATDSRSFSARASFRFATTTREASAKAP